MVDKNKKKGVTAPHNIPSDEATISQGRRPSLLVHRYWLEFDRVSIGPRRWVFQLDCLMGSVNPFTALS